MNDISRLLNKIPRTAQRLGVSIRQVYVLRDRGEIEIVRDGRSAFVVAASEEAYVERLRQKARQARRPVTEITAS